MGRLERVAFAGDGFDQRRLAGPVGTEDGNVLPEGNGKCNRVESLIPVAEDGNVAEIDQRGGLVSRIGVGRHEIVGWGDGPVGKEISPFGNLPGRRPQAGLPTLPNSQPRKAENRGSPQDLWKLSHHAGCVCEKRIVNGFQDGNIAHVNGHTFRVGVIASEFDSRVIAVLPVPGALVAAL